MLNAEAVKLMRRTLQAAAILSLAVGAARADFNAEVSASPDFTAGLTRVTVIAVACHESVDWSTASSRSVCRSRTAATASAAAPLRGPGRGTARHP